MVIVKTEKVEESCSNDGRNCEGQVSVGSKIGNGFCVYAGSFDEYYDETFSFSVSLDVTVSFAFLMNIL